MSEFQVNYSHLKQDADNLSKYGNEMSQIYSELHSIKQLNGLSWKNVSRLQKNINAQSSILQEELTAMRTLSSAMDRICGKYSSTELKAMNSSNLTDSGKVGQTTGIASTVISAGTSMSGNAEDTQQSSDTVEKNNIPTENMSGLQPKFSDESIGTKVTSVTDENGILRYPYSKYRTNYPCADQLQCVGYAKGRFEELTGVIPQFRVGAANEITSQYVNDSRFECVTDINNVKVPAMAVTKGNSSYGHVLIIEDIVRDENGSPSYIYYSEANHTGKADGTLYKRSVREFYSGETMPSGYVQLR